MEFPKKNRKELVALVKDIEVMGFTVTDIDRTRSSHYKLRVQRGDQFQTIIAPTTPSDWRSYKNVLRSLNRIDTRK